MSQVVLRNVHKRFGRVVAVEDFSLTVGAGEFVALLGPSGCGKTTTLKIIAGLEHPDSGDVLIKGTVATEWPPYRRDVGLVFQHYALFPHMTVTGNVAYGLRMRGISSSEIASRVDWALGMVRLEGFAERFPRQLSGGQQQRVAVARAIVIQPSVLLFDEPLSNLDARLRQEMRDELRDLQKSLAISTIFVTHDQEEALSMADRVVVMNAGRVEQVGTPAEIYHRPESEFVARFIGECNFLRGKIVALDDKGALFSCDGLLLHLVVSAKVDVGAVGVAAIRPENVVVLRSGAADTGIKLLSGTIVATTYLGAFTRLRIRLDQGTELVALQPGPRPDQRAPGQGERVQVGWPSESAVFHPTGTGQYGA